MRLVTRADLDAQSTGDGNTTAAHACRPVRGPTEWSAHACGLANAYLDREWRRPGMTFADGPVVRAFDRVGWTRGGTFQSELDLHPFSANGR